MNISTEQQERFALLVLGMHRSGTSALAGLLAKSGSVGPLTQLEPKADNPIGFGESAEFMDFNNDLLERTNRHWDTVFALSDHDLTMIDADGRTKRALSHSIQREFPSGNILVIKDPRICILTDVWFEALALLNIQPLPIIPLRNPLESAESLFKRDNMPLEQGLLLWLRHVLEAEFATRGMRRCIISFDDILKSEKDTIDIVKAAFEPHLAPLRIKARSKKFVQPKLRHHRAAENGFAAFQSMAEWLQATYASMQSLSDPEISEDQRKDAHHTLDIVRADLNKSCCRFEPILGWQQRLLNQSRQTVAALSDAQTSDGDAVSIEATISGLLKDLESSKQYAAFSDREAEIERKALLEDLTKLELSAKNDVVKLNGDIEALKHKASAAQKAFNDKLKSLKDLSQSELNEVRQEHAKQLEKASATLEKTKKEIVSKIKFAKEQEQRLEVFKKAEAQANATLRKAERTTLRHKKKSSDFRTQLQAERLARFQMEDERDRALDAISQVNDARLAEERKSRDLSSQLVILENKEARATRRAKSFEARSGRLMAALIAQSHSLSILQKAKLAWCRRIVARSGLFDEAFYSKQLRRDGVEPGMSLIRHYLTIGESFGYAPHPLFDPSWYAKKYQDVSDQGLSLLLHYIQYGAKEARHPHPVFTPETFESSLPTESMPNRDKLTPVVRYCMFGLEEKSKPHAEFDTAFYLRTYPDVAKAGVTPLVHYLTMGFYELRSPNSEFDEKWYRSQYSNLIGEHQSGLHFHLTQGRLNGFQTNPTKRNLRARQRQGQATQKKILVVAHAANERLFGAERSLLDVLKVIDPETFHVTLALPNPSQSHIKSTKPYADALVEYPHSWWTRETPEKEELITFFEELIKAENIDLVYGNTIMLRETFTAAKRQNIPSVRHIRELIVDDIALQSLIGMPAKEIVSSTLEKSDYIIANSEVTAAVFNKPDRTFTIHNAVDTDKLNLAFRKSERNRLRVGMLSSNLEKKGLSDLHILATRAAELQLPIDFYAYGPHTSDVENIKRKVIDQKGPHNLHFPGYVEESSEAIAALDVVINLSHFAESFGRTIAEAMAARRPVIGYDRGALPDVIGTTGCGIVIPHRKPLEAIPYLKTLLNDRKELFKAGEKGRMRAEELFALSVLDSNINTVLESVLRHEDAFDLQKAKPRIKPHQATSAFVEFGKQRTAPKISAIIPNYNYGRFLKDRIESILNQTFPPSEIIFLDDNSSDNSIEIAEQLLKHNSQHIPVRFITNKVNKGVYHQWLKGINVAESDWVWIAEADDVCELNFLETLSQRTNPEINIVYSQSRKIDENNTILSADYLHHTNDISKTRWLSDYIENGPQEVLNAIAFRNTIPNTSAALLRKSAVNGIEDQLLKFEFAGDWLLYAHMLKTGGLAFVSTSLNSFRRHASSVTKLRNKSEKYLIELAKVRKLIAESFPILPRHFEMQNAFLDKDYIIEGNLVNSKNPAISTLLKTAQKLAADRKRIAFITTNNGSYNGGSEILWQETAARLLAEGYDVIVLIKKWDPIPELLKTLFAAGAQVLFKEENGFNSLMNLEPDLTVISVGDQDEGTEYYTDLQAAGLPYTIVNQLTKETRFWPIREKKQRAVKSGYLGAEKTYFTCWNNKRVMEKRLGQDLPNGDVHFNPYHIDRNKVPAFPSMQKGPQIAIPSKLLFVHKGQDILLEAATLPEFSTLNWTFNFYGQGPDRDVLERRIKDLGLKNFRLHGRINKISDIWKKNHALLMPSRMEGLPIMMVSALLSSRMCIATDIGGHGEVIQEGVSGYLISDPEPDSLLNTLKTANSNVENWQSMGQAGRKFILDYLPEDPVVDFTKKLEIILGKGRSRASQKRAKKG